LVRVPGHKWLGSYRNAPYKLSGKYVTVELSLRLIYCYDGTGVVKYRNISLVLLEFTQCYDSIVYMFPTNTRGLIVTIGRGYGVVC
jgi:hypothetical protein